MLIFYPYQDGLIYLPAVNFDNMASPRLHFDRSASMKQNEPMVVLGPMDLTCGMFIDSLYLSNMAHMTGQISEINIATNVFAVLDDYSGHMIKRMEAKLELEKHGKIFGWKILLSDLKIVWISDMFLKRIESMQKT